MRLNKINVVFLHKISCIRQFENKFSCAHLHYLYINRKQNKDIKYD